MNQHRHGGQWNDMGVFAFTGGQDYSVALTDGQVIAVSKHTDHRCSRTPW
jgi:hypothetical protein